MNEDLKIIYKDISELHDYKNNARKNDAAIDKVAESILKFGFKVPVVIDNKNVIVCGHTRIKACKKIGVNKIPCIVASDLSEEQIKAFRLVDNKVSEFSEWDLEKLAVELQDLQSVDFDLSDFGFDLDVFFEDEIKEENNHEVERKDHELKESISIIIECKDDIEAEQFFYKLQNEGYKCRISTL